MNDAVTEVFFYGLFMDPEALRAKGLDPQSPRKAAVADMALRIGKRATLVPQKDSVVHGVVMALTAPEIERLYADPSVAAYQAEPIVVHGADGTSIAAVCYNLPGPEEVQPNSEYAAKLREVARKVDLPADYISGIG